MYGVRAFVRMRELAASYGNLAKRLVELEEKTEALATKHDTFSRNTRNQLRTCPRGPSTMGKLSAVDAKALRKVIGDVIG